MFLSKSRKMPWTLILVGLVGLTAGAGVLAGKLAVYTNSAKAKLAWNQMIEQKSFSWELWSSSLKVRTEGADSEAIGQRIDEAERKAGRTLPAHQVTKMLRVEYGDEPLSREQAGSLAKIAGGALLVGILWLAIRRRNRTVRQTRPRANAQAALPVAEAISPS